MASHYINGIVLGQLKGLSLPLIVKDDQTPNNQTCSELFASILKNGWDQTTLFYKVVTGRVIALSAYLESNNPEEKVLIAALSVQLAALGILEAQAFQINQGETLSAVTERARSFDSDAYITALKNFDQNTWRQQLKFKDHNRDVILKYLSEGIKCTQRQIGKHVPVSGVVTTYR